MSGGPKPAIAPLDASLQALSLAPGLPLAPDDAVAAAPPEPAPKPETLLDRVLRSHPALTREEAIADILASGGDPFESPELLHAWRRRGQPAYLRKPRIATDPAQE